MPKPSASQFESATISRAAMLLAAVCFLALGLYLYRSADTFWQDRRGFEVTPIGNEPAPTFADESTLPGDKAGNIQNAASPDTGDAGGISNP